MAYLHAEDNVERGQRIRIHYGRVAHTVAYVSAPDGLERVFMVTHCGRVERSAWDATQLRRSCKKCDAKTAVL